MSLLRVVIAEDHPVTRLGLKALLETASGFHLVGDAADGASALEMIRTLQPDVALVDWRLPALDAAGLLQALKLERNRSRVLVLTGVGSVEQARLALQSGAYGFLRKSADPEDIVRAVRMVARGQRVIDPELTAELASAPPGATLSVRELEVLRAMVDGASNREIGLALGVSEATVRTHVSNLLFKLDARDRTEAVTLGLRRGLIEL